MSALYWVPRTVSKKITGSSSKSCGHTCTNFWDYHLWRFFNVILNMSTQSTQSVNNRKLFHSDYTYVESEGSNTAWFITVNMNIINVNSNDQTFCAKNIYFVNKSTQRGTPEIYFRNPIKKLLLKTKPLTTNIKLTQQTKRSQNEAVKSFS